MVEEGARFSPKKNKSHTFCSVPLCSSKGSANPELRFHLFPPAGQTVVIHNKFGVKEICERRKLWIIKSRIGKPLTKNMLVCSRHFLKSDYILPDVPAKNRYLKKIAVPSLNLPPSSVVVKEPKVRAKPKERIAAKNLEPLANDDGLQTESTDAVDGNQMNAMVMDAVDGLLSLGEIGTKEIATQATPEKKDFSCQVSSGDFKTEIWDIIDTPKKLITTTGIDSFKKFEELLLVFNAIHPENNRGHLRNKGRVLMTLMKLKLNLSFAFLSILFACTGTTCKNIFASTVISLSFVLKRLVVWPSKLEIMQSMPTCFDKFRNVRVVLDCTEVKISRFNCLKCRIVSYSHYKGSHTVKFLVGVTPAGVISFRSHGYGGRTSDKKIFEESGLLQMLEPFSDDVMVDKGFLIRNLCESNFIGLIHPPFLKKKKQFEREDALETSDIAKARVHVERVIERMKKFKILSDVLPVNLLDLVDNIMLVICGLTNLSKPILAENKFLDQ